MTKKKTKKKQNLLSSIFNNKKRTDTEEAFTAFLISKGKIITLLTLSIVSAGIDCVFFSGLSKSDYSLFSILIPAAIVLSIMSLGFSFAKLIVASQLAALKEIQVRIKAMGYAWADNFNKAKIKWHLVHKFLISISIITSISLSTITIGNGVRKMEMNIKNMSEDTTALLEFQSNIKTGNNDKRDNAKGNLFSGKNANDEAKQQIDQYWPYVEEYRKNRDEIEVDESLTEEEKASQIKTLRDKVIQRVPLLGSKNIEYISRSEYEVLLANKIKEGLSNKEYDELYNQAVQFDQDEANNLIIALQDKDYRYPSGEQIDFLNEDGTPVNISLAISRLQRAIMDWQVDTGDAGPSSKVFQLLATYIHAKPSAGGMGFSEIIMMLLICIFGIVQEYLIAIFTPKAVISRKMLYQFTEYFGADFDSNRFMLQTYKDYLDNGAISTEAFEEKAEKCVRQMEYGIEDIIQKYTTKSESSKENEEHEKNEKALRDLLKKTTERAVHFEEAWQKDVGQADDAYAKLAKMYNELKLLKQQNPELENKVSELTEEIETLKTSLEDIGNENSELKTSLKDVSDNFIKAVDDKNLFETKLKELQIKKDEIDKLKAENASLTEENIKLKNTYIQTPGEENFKSIKDLEDGITIVKPAETEIEELINNRPVVNIKRSV